VGHFVLVVVDSLLIFFDSDSDFARDKLKWLRIGDVCINAARLAEILELFTAYLLSLSAGVLERDVLKNLAIFVLAFEDLPGQLDALAVPRVRHFDFGLDDLRQINAGPQQIVGAPLLLRRVE
jgi:hypothetical protein